MCCIKNLNSLPTPKRWSGCSRAFRKINLIPFNPWPGTRLSARTGSRSRNSPVHLQRRLFLAGAHTARAHSRLRPAERDREAHCARAHGVARNGDDGLTVMSKARAAQRAGGLPPRFAEGEGASDSRRASPDLAELAGLWQGVTRRTRHAMALSRMGAMAKRGRVGRMPHLLMNVPLFSSFTACLALSVGVHDDRPVPGDRPLDRLPRHQQEPDAFIASLHHDFVAGVEHHQ